MAQMGIGYGSEFHLLRYLGYHRHELNRAVEGQTGGHVIDWLDFAFGTQGKPDGEWKGVDFLESASDVKSAWLNFWPQTGNVPNWDAVGRLELHSGIEYLLIEAKAHVEELQSTCGANERGGLDKIRKALETTIQASGFTADVKDWLSPYYQYANRLAHLHFLITHHVPARLVFIYFCGDNWADKRLNGKSPECPRESNGWEAHLKKVHKHLHLSGHTQLEQRVHKLFLPV
jgi:hypothetical protein